MTLVGNYSSFGEGRVRCGVKRTETTLLKYSQGSGGQLDWSHITGTKGAIARISNFETRLGERKSKKLRLQRKS